MTIPPSASPRPLAQPGPEGGPTRPFAPPTVPRLQLAGAAKKFGEVIAVYPMDLEVRAGEFLVLLGPSGCGKTTTLRMLAGLEKPSQGSVLMDGVDVTGMRPGDRDMAFVFQMFSLYPHMTVLENVAFPLRAQGLPASEAERRAADLLRQMRLQPLAHLRPSKLSGGDQQRVGLARALIRTQLRAPKAFLMDEPLGTLDGALREETRTALRTAHNQSGATTVFVTHDQDEAMSLADRIAVMREGKILQLDTPRAIYDQPADLFVADFVGSPGMNLFPARRQGDVAVLSALPLTIHFAADLDAPEDVASRATGPTGAVGASSRNPGVTQAGNSAANQPGDQGPCWLGVRPQNVILSETGAPCRVQHTESLGSHNLLTLRHAEGLMKAWLPAGVRFDDGATVCVSFLASGCRWFDGVHGKAQNWRTVEVECRATA